MLSLLKYDKGCIHIFGEEMRPDNYKVKQQIGIVLQNVAVFDVLTVYENIDYFCGLYIPDKKKRKALVEETITFADLQAALQRDEKSSNMNSVGVLQTRKPLRIKGLRVFTFSKRFQIRHLDCDSLASVYERRNQTP